MIEVTDPNILQQLEGSSSLKEITDPNLLAKLNAKESVSVLDNTAYGVLGKTPREIGGTVGEFAKFYGNKGLNLGLGAEKGFQDVGGTVTRGIAGLYDSALGTNLGQYVDAKNKAVNAQYENVSAENPEAGVGRVLGNTIATLPTAAINPFNKVKYIGQILNGAAQGAAAAGLTSSAKDAPLSDQMASGGITGAGAQVVINLLSNAVGGAARAIQPFTKAGIDKIAAKLISANSDNPTAIPNAIRNAPQFIPGSTPTVAQSSQGSGDYGINSLEKGIKNIVPDAFKRKAAEQGMAQNRALEGMMPEGTVEQLKAAREGATSGLYDMARNAPADAEGMVPVFGKIEEQMANVGDTKAGELLKALKAKITSNFQYENSGPLIQLYKETRDELAKKAEQAGYLGSSVKGVVGPINREFGKALAESNPALAQADSAYANLSKPINQKQLLQEIQQKIQNPESNYLTDESTMSLSKLATQMRNMAPEIQKDLTPAQQAGLGSLRDDLNRIASTESANVKGVSQQSLSNLGTKNVLNSLGKNKRVTAIMDMPAVSKLGGWVYGARDPVIQERLAELLANPQKMNTADLIEKASQMSGITPRQRGIIVNLLVHGNRGLQGNPNN